MSFIIWLIAGGLLGWIASMLMQTDAQQRATLNVVVGVVGSLLGAWLIAPMFGSGTINRSDFSATGLMSSLLGAVILLGVFNLFWRGKVR
jgi:uncharacterized membrane protein YeaQ/YmgE (transglycosylase-associated protein family)